MSDSIYILNEYLIQDISNIVLEYAKNLIIPSLFGNLNPCCDECFDNFSELEYRDDEARDAIFQSYLDKYVEEIDYKEVTSNLVNYFSTKNIIIRKYTFKLKGKDESFTLYANCEDKCTCCYGDNCSEKDESHVCLSSTCDCGIYHGNKYHVRIDSLENICIDDEQNEINVMYTSCLNSVLNENISETLKSLEPFECVVAILSYRPFIYIRSDK